MYDTIVRITVGSEKALFHVHKGLICNASAYFKAAFEGEFKEASEQLLDLPEERPQMFKRFLLWLYSGSIIESPKETCDKIHWKDLFGLYIFGDARSIPALQNAVIDALIDKCEQTDAIPTHYFVYIYDNTVDKSPLRRLVVDWIIYGIDHLAYWSGFDTKDRRKCSSSSISSFMYLECGTLTPCPSIDHFPRECLFDIIMAQAHASGKSTLKPLDFKRIRELYYVPIPNHFQDDQTGGAKVSPPKVSIPFQ